MYEIECTGCGETIDIECLSDHFECYMVKRDIELMEGMPCPSGCETLLYSEEELNEHFCEQRIAKAMEISDN